MLQFYKSPAKKQNFLTKIKESIRNFVHNHPIITIVACTAVGIAIGMHLNFQPALVQPEQKPAQKPSSKCDLVKTPKDFVKNIGKQIKNTGNQIIEKIKGKPTSPAATSVNTTPVNQPQAPAKPVAPNNANNQTPQAKAENLTRGDALAAAYRAQNPKEYAMLEREHLRETNIRSPFE